MHDLSHACLLHSRVTSLGPVTRLGWLGLAQPKLGGLDPAPQKKKKEKRVGRIWALGPANPNYVY